MKSFKLVFDANSGVAVPDGLAQRWASRALEANDGDTITFGTECMLYALRMALEGRNDITITSFIDPDRVDVEWNNHNHQPNGMYRSFVDELLSTILGWGQ